MNPVSYLFEGLRSLVIFGWDGEALALGFGIAAVIAALGIVGAPRRAAHAAGADMRRFRDVAAGVAWRSVHKLSSRSRSC